MADLRRQRWRLILLVVFTLLFYVTLPVLGLQDPSMTTPDIFVGPSPVNLLGTDQFGRDNLSRTLWALRTGVVVSMVSTAIAGALGGLLGAMALLGSWIDRLVTTLIDALLAIPGLLLALVLLTFFPPALIYIAVAVGVSLSPVFARVTRGALLSVRTQGYVQAAEALGARDVWILRVHLIPNAADEITSFLGVIFSWAALNIAALDFLGLAGSPSAPSFGNLLNDGRLYLRATPWIAFGPGLALTALTILAFSVSNTRDSR